MDFLAQGGYTSSYLWTTHEQTTAASLYQQYGFTLTEEKTQAHLASHCRSNVMKLQFPFDEA